MENSNDNVKGKVEFKKIDLKGIDWNELSIEEFNRLSKEYDERDKELKKTRERKKRDQKGEVPFSIHGKVYMVKNSLVEKYKKMRSEKSKEKFLKMISETCDKVEEL